MMDQDDCNDCTDTAVSIEGATSRVFEIVNRKGLHARATAKFVQCAESFDAEIFVSRCGETVGGSSIMGILTLGAGIGSTITVSARGAQALEALADAARAQRRRLRRQLARELGARGREAERERRRGQQVVGRHARHARERGARRLDGRHGAGESIQGTS